MRQPRPTFRRSRVKAHWRFRTMTESARLAFRRRNRLRCSCWALAWRVYRSFAVASRNLTSTVFAFQGRRVIAGSFFVCRAVPTLYAPRPGQVSAELPATRRCVDLLRPVSLPWESRFTTDSVQRSVAAMLRAGVQNWTDCLLLHRYIPLCDHYASTIRCLPETRRRSGTVSRYRRYD